MLFIDFNCAANLGGGLGLQRVVNCGEGHTKSKTTCTRRELNHGGKEDVAVGEFEESACEQNFRRAKGNENCCCCFLGGQRREMGVWVLVIIS